MPRNYSIRKSESLYNRSKDYLVDAVSSPSRGSAFYSPHPVFMERGSGAQIVDVDGNSYIDYVMGYSTLIHGHANRTIVDTIARKSAEGTHFATATPEEAELAEMVVSLFPSIDKLRFTSTGTEAVMMAVRLARAYSSRKKILKFEGHYHGWYDHVLYNIDPQLSSTLGAERDPVIITEGSGLPEEVSRNLVTVWNDPDELRRVVGIHKNEIACIITEPVMANLGIIPPDPGYLRQVQEIASENDIPFILDETVTGFRTYPGGAQLDMKLDPDITIFGKALGAGMQVAAYGGRDEIMRMLHWGSVLSYGTQNAHRLSISVAIESLKMSLRNGGEPLKNLNILCSRLSKGLSDISAGTIVQSYGSLVQLYFLKTDCDRIRSLRDYVNCVDSRQYLRFANSLRENGVLVPHSQGLHLALSTAHTQKHVDETLRIVKETMEQLEKQNNQHK